MKGLVPGICKEVYNSVRRHLIKIWGKDLNKHFTTKKKKKSDKKAPGKMLKTTRH